MWSQCPVLGQATPRTYGTVHGCYRTHVRPTRNLRYRTAFGPNAQCWGKPPHESMELYTAATCRSQQATAEFSFEVELAAASLSEQPRPAASRAASGFVHLRCRDSNPPKAMHHGPPANLHNKTQAFDGNPRSGELLKQILRDTPRINLK